MATITSNIYPPILPDAVNAFVRTSSCRVYFSLSQYNATTDIKNAQISLINQRTNQSVLSSNLYPSGIKIINNTNNFNYNANTQGDYKYYIDIPISDIVNNEFEINQYYVLQMRFTSKDAPNPPSSGTGLDSWLFSNRDYFSEWSTMCLIRGIDQPYISMTGLNEGETVESKASVKDFQVPLTMISGKLYYNNSLEEEYLKNYNINIYKTGSPNHSIYKTQQSQINPYNPNEFNCKIPYDFENNVSYTLAFTYITNNGYTQTLYYKFKISTTSAYSLDGVITITPENNSGRIKFDIDFETKYCVKTDKDLIIKRASSKNNFKFWKEVKTITHTQDLLRHVWYDTTVESGVWYKYRIQEKVSSGVGKMTEYEHPVMCLFEDMYLSNEERQLKIQFNPVVSDYKYNLTESQQTTLGAKFPYIKRNGNNFFRTFSIGGLISAFMDNDNWYDCNFFEGNLYTPQKRETFTSPFEIYQEGKELYDNYNQTYNITKYNDDIYEREFRKKVSDFLYEDNIKLFRSTPEGNVLVKLMNVSFQPVDTLGRRLYSFSATAVEISEADIENYLKYNIMNKYFYYFKTGNISGVFKSKESIVDKILATSNFLNYNKEIFKILRLNIQLNNYRNNQAVFYVKTEGEPQYKRHIIPSSGNLLLSYPDNLPVENCYFYGIHLNDNSYTILDEYHMSTSEISNPKNNTVYYIFDEDQTNRINNYISYSKYDRLLTTVEEETQIRRFYQYGNSIILDYTLYAERAYRKYIRYNNAWYPFSNAGDVLIDTINANINFYYEIKEAN